jgi:PHP family Zn ribbon phosphoesterase
MLSLEDYKNALGQEVDALSDVEIERLNILSAQLASTLFKMWSGKLKEKTRVDKNDGKHKICDY